MANVGYATLSIVPSMQGVKAKLSKELGGTAESAGKSAGGRLGSALMTGVKRVGLGAAAAVGGALTVALAKGWGRLTQIENATAKLDGLGHSAKTVETIMGNALASVKGTAFGLGDAATVAASAVAAGVKPGQDLQRTLGLIADTATIAGAPLSDIGSIFNQVAAGGKLFLGEVNQLADRGVPVLQMVADELGVTAGEAAKMVSAGQVDFNTFRKAIENNIAGAALKSGETTQGAYANMMAAGGRFGASLLEGVFPLAKKVFGGLTGFIDEATTKVKPWAESFSTWINSTVVPAAENLMAKAGELGTKIREFFDSSTGEKLKTDTFEKFQSIFEKLSGAAKNLAPAVTSIAGSLGKASGAIGISTWELLLKTVDLLASVANAVLVPAVEKLAGWMERNQGAVTALVGAYVAWKTAAMGIKAAQTVMAGYQVTVMAVKAAQQAYAFTTYGMAAATGKLTLAQKAGVVAAKLVAAATWLWNAAMSANPIGIVVIAIAALVGGLILAYKKSETFRKIVHAALDGVKVAAIWLWENGIKPLWEGIKVAFDAISAVISFWWTNIVSPYFGFVMRIVKSLAALWWWLFSSAIKPVIAGIKTYLEIAGAVWGWLYNNAIKPAVNGIASLAKWLYSNAIKPTFDKIAAAAKFLYNNGIKPAFDGIASAAKWVYNNGIRPTFDKIISIVGKVRDTFKAAFSKIGGFISSAFGTAVSTAKGAINSLINLVNRATSALNSSVIGKLNKIPGVDFPSIPKIPNLAKGGVIPATPGGRIVRVAEAGKPEAVIPLDRLDRMLGGRRDDRPPLVQNFYPAADLDERAVATMAARRIAAVGVS